MSEQTQAPKANAAAARGRDPESDNAVEEVRYDRDYLVSHSRALLRSESIIVAGALAETPNRKTFTLKDAEKHVKEFLKAPIPHDNEEATG